MTCILSAAASSPSTAGSLHNPIRIRAVGARFARFFAAAIPSERPVGAQRGFFAQKREVRGLCPRRLPLKAQTKIPVTYRGRDLFLF